MPIVADKIELQTHDDDAVLRMEDVEKYSDGSVYACNLVVRSNGFACERPFSFDDSHLPAAVKALREMASG